LGLLLADKWETIVLRRIKVSTVQRHLHRIVESWLRRQGLIEVRPNRKPKVSTIYQHDLVSLSGWFHNFVYE
jgi:hypothetical protein